MNLKSLFDNIEKRGYHYFTGTSNEVCRRITFSTKYNDKGNICEITFLSNGNCDVLTQREGQAKPTEVFNISTTATTKIIKDL